MRAAQDVFLIIRDDADEADLCRGDEAEAIRLAVLYDASRVVRMYGDGVWRDCTGDLAVSHFAANGPDSTFPDSFLRELDDSMIRAYRRCHGEAR